MSSTYTCWRCGGPLYAWVDGQPVCDFHYGATDDPA